jgi:site-specific DNA-methyltransferase (adenine-specific)
LPLTPFLCPFGAARVNNSIHLSRLHSTFVHAICRKLQIAHLYIVPESKVFIGDCMDGMRQLPDKYFDLAIVDPPYGIGANKMTLGNGKRTVFRGNDDWDRSAPDLSYFQELRRVSKEQIIWGANHFIANNPINSSCWIVWDKGTGDNDFADCELAWTSFNKTVRKYFQSWVGANAKERNEPDRMHPTQKPVALYKWLLKNYAKPGDKILDTHLGSGSSRIASYDMGFDFWGWEIDKDYFEAQEKRFRQFVAQQKLFTWPQ